MIKHRRSMQK